MLKRLFNFCNNLGRRIKQWVKPTTAMLVTASLTDMTRSKADLIAENAMLRQQLIVLNRQVKRPQLTNRDRLRLVLLARCTQFWQQALHIVQPDTLIRWHRELFRLYWRYRSRQKNRKPRLSQELILHCLQLHRLVREYVAYYNQARPHQGIEQQIPDWYERDCPLATGPIIATPVLNGLHHDYSRASAYLH